MVITIYSISLTLVPVVRERSWEASLQWSHWAGWALWVFGFTLVHIEVNRRLPVHDPYLLPIASLLSGWGIMVTWRLFPEFGIRQSAWLAFVLIIFTIGLRLPSNLGFLKNYKYLWLTIGLLITALTLVFGKNPSDSLAPRLWLGCCGVYFQPSEILKLLLVIYLAAYLADKTLGIANKSSHQNQLPGSINQNLISLLAPTVLMTGAVVALLLIQRDLGTASIFLLIYAALVFVATGRRRFIFLSILGLGVAILLGYSLFSIVKIRIDTWINPWADPTGNSYQIVQSLIAIANGGIFGRGLGLGSPSLVPVPHSDFIFSSITEESGLFGAASLLLILAFFTYRGLIISLNATGSFRRLLAVGLTTFLTAQSILIIGGNIRLLPLTGVTLPFVSYGGSSLLTSFFCLLLLIHISNTENREPSPLINPKPYLYVAAFIWTGLALSIITVGWWTVVRSPRLTNRTDNYRRAISDRFVPRGSILDRNDNPLSITEGKSGKLLRRILVPSLSNIIGYTHPVFGQSGLEANLDPYLRGYKGNPNRLVEINQLLYGQPPPGLDVRSSLDLTLQNIGAALMDSHRGGIILLDSQTGEILSMVSTPSFDANNLDTSWAELLNNPEAPLLNRMTQGSYPPGGILGPFLLGELGLGSNPPLNSFEPSISIDSVDYACAEIPTNPSLVEAVEAGCPGAVYSLGGILGLDKTILLLTKLGLMEKNSPQNYLPKETGLSISDLAGRLAVGAAVNSGDLAVEKNGKSVQKNTGIKINPLKLASAATVFTNQGIRSEPQFALAVNTPSSGWLPFINTAEGVFVFPEAVSTTVKNALQASDASTWEVVSSTLNGQAGYITWYIAGTQPNGNQHGYSVLVLLEENNPTLARLIGQKMLYQVRNNP